jgi:hypothetical protein
MEFLKEFGRFMMVRKKYWLVPILLAMLFIGFLIVFSKGSATAPFIYTIF